MIDKVKLLKELVSKLDDLYNHGHSLSVSSKAVLLDAKCELYKELQTICPHNIEHVEKDHNGDYYCTYCGDGYMSDGLTFVTLRKVPELTECKKRIFSAIEAYNNPMFLLEEEVK